MRWDQSLTGQTAQGERDTHLYDRNKNTIRS